MRARQQRRADQQPDVAAHRVERVVEFVARHAHERAGRRGGGCDRRARARHRLGDRRGSAASAAPAGSSRSPRLVHARAARPPCRARRAGPDARSWLARSASTARNAASVSSSDGQPVGPGDAPERRRRRPCARGSVTAAVAVLALPSPPPPPLLCAWSPACRASSRREPSRTAAVRAARRAVVGALGRAAVTSRRPRSARSLCEPLVRVATGALAAERPADATPDAACAPLVRVATAPEPEADPLPATGRASRSRRSAPPPAPLRTRARRSATAPRGVGKCPARSWRTTWIVRRITCVRYCTRASAPRAWRPVLSAGCSA